MSPLFHGALGGRFPIRRRWSIETWLFVPITAGLAANADGQIATRPLFLGGGLEHRLTRLDNPWSFFLGAGLGPLLIHFEGTTSNAAQHECGSNTLRELYPGVRTWKTLYEWAMQINVESRQK